MLFKEDWYLFLSLKVTSVSFVATKPGAIPFTLIPSLAQASAKVFTKVKEEGCQVDLQVWEDMVHVWQGYAPFLPEALEALKSIGKFINKD